MEISKNEKISIEELTEAATPLVELLRKKGHPHMTVVVTERNVVVTADVMGVPLKFDD